MNGTRSKYVDPSAVIGYAPRFLQGARPWALESIGPEGAVHLPEAVYVGPFAAIGAGALIGNGCVIDAYCRVEPLAKLGEDSVVLYRGTVGVSAVVGKRCIIGGSVSENTIVEDDCTSLGKLIHSHWDSMSPWDDRDDPEASPIVRRRSFVGHDALVIGGIEIGPSSYVCAGATVTRSVPQQHIVYGVNKIVHFSQWRGKLAQNPIFR
ncbi:MAG: hypothetical protein IT430_20590 [Phycisphaerales bacterium]|nr:hypothetical protein [Phycisphaerales bacterium]